jgi:hypothetical protein
MATQPNKLKKQEMPIAQRIGTRTATTTQVRTTLNSAEIAQLSARTTSLSPAAQRRKDQAAKRQLQSNLIFIVLLVVEVVTITGFWMVAKFVEYATVNAGEAFSILFKALFGI